MAWIEERRGESTVFAPDDAPPGVTLGFSGRGVAPADTPWPTAVLARRFSSALGLDGIPIHWAHQVHGNAAVTIREKHPGGEPNVGSCDALATDLPSTALVVQTADCVPILLAAPRAVGAAHAGWRGTAKNVAAAAVRSLVTLGTEAASIRAWLGPTIGPCCYEVGGEVAAQFAGEFVRAGCGGGFRLDLKSVNAAQLEAAGILRESISIHPACTKCGGEKYASWRRDRERAGRMIALIAMRG